MRRIGKGSSRTKDRIRSPEMSLLFSSLRSSGSNLESLSFRQGALTGIWTVASDGCRWRVPLMISEKDAKIIRLMAERRENQIQNEKSALAAHSIWEKEKLAEEKKSKEKKKQLSKYLEKKREAERFLHTLKKDGIIKNLNEEAIDLENKIAEELEKAQNRQHILFQKKMENLKKWSDYQSQVRRAIQQEKAKFEEMEKNRRLAAVEAKEKRCQEKLSRLSLETKMRGVRECQKRKLRWEAAKNVREEMHTKLLQTRIQNLQFNIKHDQIRTQNAIEDLELRKKITHEKNLIKQHRHDLLLTKVLQDNQLKLQQTQAKILQKDLRTKQFTQKLNMGIAQGKIYARTTAGLRQNIQASYTF